MAFRQLSVSAAVACALISSPLYAQRSGPEVPAQPQAPKLDPKACTDRDRLTRGDTVETEGHAPSQEDASDKLARTDGVICPPPGLDPAIPAPTNPGASNMPVIPPPGSPGGDTEIRPK